MNISFPKEFHKLLGEALPENEVVKLIESLGSESQTCVRMNPTKKIELIPDLIESKVAHCEDAFLLKKRPSFVADPAFHAGLYYVQEASSTVIGTVVEKLLENISNPIIALDLCAAPGGKSTHVASKLRKHDLLIANEIIQSRTPILHENLCKWGLANHIVTRADAKQFGSSGLLMDLVIADMPCSGEGLFRKDRNAIEEWSIQNVGICEDRQKRIAADIWPCLAEGGYMVYSTCTYNRKENEENVNWIMKELGADLVQFNFPDNYRFFETTPGMYRLLPHLSVGEGFFFAVLQKTGKAKEKEPKQLQRISFKHDFGNYFTEEISVFDWNKEVYFINSIDEQKIKRLLTQLPSIYAPSTPMGKEFDKKFKPESTLALHAFYNHNQYPVSTLNDKEIISYFRRESLPNPDKILGIHAISWNKIICGFANGVKNNSNNLWPMEWRIRKEGIVAETIVTI